MQGHIYNMISILLPSRGRPQNLHRLAESVKATATNPDDIEIIVFIDHDDVSYHEHQPYPSNIWLYRTFRTVLSEYWNLAYKEAKGDILMHCGDDIVFKTDGWDDKVKEAFDQYPDNIVLVHGDDGDPTHKNFGTHSFVHRDWVETLGYFVPPYFSSDYNDTWLNELADGIGRKHRVDILTEHMHFAYHKGELDLTHAERLVRHFADKNTEIYDSKVDERKADMEKLKKVML